MDHSAAIVLGRSNHAVVCSLLLHELRFLRTVSWVRLNIITEVITILLNLILMKLFIVTIDMAALILLLIVMVRGLLIPSVHHFHIRP